MARCERRCPSPPIPPGLSIERAATHPRFRYWLEPGAPCERDAGHDGPHRNGLLSWHDPPIVEVR